MSKWIFLEELFFDISEVIGVVMDIDEFHLAIFFKNTERLVKTYKNSVEISTAYNEIIDNIIDSNFS